MNVETARSILDIDNDNAIIMVGWHYAYWAPGESRIVLDGAYTSPVSELFLPEGVLHFCFVHLSRLFCCFVFAIILL